MNSKIKNIVLENFMAFSNTIIDFDDKGIINLKGYSDSGKSSILIAVAVVFNNFKPTKQVNWIKDDCKYFRIEINFDDGVKIVRYKYSTGQSLYEMFENGYLVYSSKVNNQLTPISDVPEIIAQYLNLAKLESGILNFRTNQDKQFLAQTTGKENFQDLNNLFGIEEILWAINSCKADISNYSAEMQKNTMEIEYLEAKLEESKELTQETLVRVLEEDKLLDLAESKSRELSAISGSISILEMAKDLPEIQEIKSPIDRIFNINSLIGVVLEADLSPINEVPLDRLKTLNSIDSTLNNLGSNDFVEIPEGVKAEKLKGLLEIQKLIRGTKNVLPELKGVNIKEDKYLTSILCAVEDLKATEDTIKSIESEVTKLKNVLDSVKVKLKAKGYNLYECGNCGSFNFEGVH